MRRAARRLVELIARAAVRKAVKGIERSSEVASKSGAPVRVPEGAIQPLQRGRPCVYLSCNSG
jgi:hypothetical protein